MPAAACTRRRNEAVGLRSWLCCPGLAARRRSQAQPRASRPSTAPLRAGYPHLGGPSTAQRQLRHAGTSRSVDLDGHGPRWGMSAAKRASGLKPRAVGPSRLRFVSVSVVRLAVAAWGVVRLGGRRLRAYRGSRGRRPTGCDSEATARRVALPRRHPSEAGGRLTRTRLRRACRLQRPRSPLIVRANEDTGVSQLPQRPIVARPCWPPVGGWMFRRRSVGPRRVLPGLGALRC